MGHIAWLEERVSGFVYGRLITFHVREFAGHDHPDARTGMIVVTNVAARLICHFGNAEFVLAIQIGHMTRDNLLKTLYGLHVLRLNTCIPCERDHQKKQDCHRQDAFPFIKPPSIASAA